jgi:hypothetical protein
MLPIEDWAGAIRVRHAWRKYRRKRPIATDWHELAVHCDTFQPFEGVRVVAVERPEADIFFGFLGIGKVSDAPSVLLFIGDESVPDVEAKVGYTGEAAVLEATRRGFGTCWITGSFKRGKVKKLVELAPGERVYGVTPVGYPETGPEGVEPPRLGQGRTHKRVELSAIAPGISAGKWPTWAFEGIVAARLAPSAYNRQPWRFRFEDGAVVVSADDSGKMVGGRRLDCGIAMLHFELGALTNGGIGGWEFLTAPDVARYTIAGMAPEAAE